MGVKSIVLWSDQKYRVVTRAAPHPKGPNMWEIIVEEKGADAMGAPSWMTMVKTADDGDVSEERYAEYVAILEQALESLGARAWAMQEKLGEKKETKP
jgi:hypothetical protein